MATRRIDLPWTRIRQQLAEPKQHCRVIHGLHGRRYASDVVGESGVPRLTNNRPVFSLRMAFVRRGHVGRGRVVRDVSGAGRPLDLNLAGTGWRWEKNGRLTFAGANHNSIATSSSKERARSRTSR